MIACRIRFGPLYLMLGIALLALSSCKRAAPTAEEEQVAQTFVTFQDAVVNGDMDHACGFFADDANHYLASMAAPPDPANPPMSAEHPAVDLLVRCALAEKAPPDLRAQPTLAGLAQRAEVDHLFRPHDLRDVTLGSVTIDGDHASAAISYRGTPIALRLPFVKQADGWKIDVLALLPDVEALLRVERLLKGESEQQQIDRLIAHMPAL